MKLKSLTIALLLISGTACAPNATGASSTAAASGGTTTAAGSTTSGSTATQAAGNGPVIRYIGRVDATTPILSWPGSGVQTVFTGTSGTVTFTTKQATNNIDISIDGGAPVAAVVKTGVPIAFGPVAQGTHTVTVIKRSEALYGTLALAGFDTDGQGQATTVPSRRIEFIGDSITAGYGVDGTSPCTNTSTLENAADSYASITAANLSADPSLIAWSGKGLYRNVASTTSTDTVTMADLWLDTSAADGTTSTYDFPAASAPQAVVINLGTNDFSYIAYNSSGVASTVRSAITQTQFVGAYVDLVQQVIAKYPGVQVVLCSSPMLSDSYPSASDAQHTTQLSYLNAVATQIGGSNVHVLDFATQQTGDGINGCDSHPSKTQQAAMADTLTTQLKSILGW